MTQPVDDYEPADWRVSLNGRVAHLVAEGDPACGTDERPPGKARHEWRHVPGATRCRSCDLIDQGFRRVSYPEAGCGVWVRPIP